MPAVDSGRSGALLAASGHKQREIAEAVGLDKSVVSRIVKGELQNATAPDFTNSELTTTQRLKDELVSVSPIGYP
jgi:predicted XRE-type DNA-binding protein